ncbi:MAG: helix-turn-helix transcriptional regulator [Prevotellaceae bacterium]|nr:helix-turn-helix transcriptional regulator [Prevotellaceae bacterium]
MEEKAPRRLSFGEIKEIARELAAAKGLTPFVRGGIGMWYGKAPDVGRVLKPGTPYIMEEPRLAFLKRGRVRVTINTMDFEVSAGSVVFFGTGAIVQPKSFSRDLEICGVMVAGERIANALGVPSALAGQGSYIIAETRGEEAEIVEGIFSTLWRLIHQREQADDTINGIVSSLLRYFLHIRSLRESTLEQSQQTDRLRFERFLRLVNAHCQQQRRLSFYADKLCITPRYLGVTVRSVSGVTAKEWIDRAVSTSAKVMLRHTSKQVAEIAYELSFPSASFFCRFFKRMTGQTPQAYREG